MSIFSKIAQAIGFGPDNSRDDEQVLLDTDSIPSAPAAIPTPAMSEAIEPNPELLAHVLDQVLAVFNDALPSFLAKSVDADAQRRALYDALDQGAKNYIVSLHAAVQARCESAWAAERDRLIADAEGLRQRTLDLENKRADLKDKQLSADRQKRALAERVRDLENKVQTLEAEKEQLDLENKCMINKAKTAAVLEAEIEELRAAGAGAPAAANAKEMDELREKLAAASAEIDTLQKKLEETKIKDDMGTAMQAEYQKKAAEATRQLKAAEGEARKAKDDAEVLNARISDLQKELDQVRAQSITQPELDKLMESQIARFEEVKGKMESHISALKQSLTDAKAENESLRSTIKANLVEHATAEQALQARIDALEKAAAAPAVEAATVEAIHRAAAEDPTPDTEIDDLLQGADWLMSTPAKEQSMRDPDEADTFGYQPPARKHRPANNDNQLNLFDF